MKQNTSRIHPQLITFLSLIIITCLVVGFMFLPTIFEKAHYGEDVFPMTDTHPLSQEEDFLSSQMNFAVQLFQASAKESNYENVLISPISVMQALSMTANGAAGDTLNEMTILLAGESSLEELNEDLKLYIETLPNTEKYRLHLANSIWICDDLTVKDTFLETNKNYYLAEVFTESFSNRTVNKINRWVKKNTDNMIEKIMETCEPNDVMYLINALSFDAEWQNIYHGYSVYDGKFFPLNSKVQTAEMMHSTERIYLDDGNATGFIKNYKDGAYRFAALLPNEDVSLSDYIQGLTSEGLMQIISQAEEASVSASLPKFSYKYDINMNSILEQLGMKSAFDSSRADFSNLGYSENGPLFISNVKHSTFISVDEKGTKAGAVTQVAVNDGAAMIVKEVILNRPFLYMILDGNTNLPIFIGTVTKL